MEHLLDTLVRDWEALLRFAPRIFYAAGLLLAIWAFSRALGRALVSVLTDRLGLALDQQFVLYLVNLVLGAVGVLLALGVLGLEEIAASLLATGGVIAIIGGFAFREIGENFLAGFFLSFSRPFKLNDLIRSGQHTGTVAGIALRHVHLRTADGCDLFIPSGQIFREPLHNYTRDGLRRSGFALSLDDGRDPEQVIARLGTAVAGVKGVLKKPAPSVTVQSLSGATIEYEVLFWVDVQKRNSDLDATGNAVKIACWHALEEAASSTASPAQIDKR